jgi:hypothetical protein
MIIVFLKHSTDASGRKAVNSLLADGKDVEPKVLRGDHHATIDLIECLDFEHTYTLGVCSFEPGVEVSSTVEEDVMDRFEYAAFAGLDKDQYCILWIRNQDKGRHQLHFVVPRVELSTGKSLNIAPPGHFAFFDALCDTINFDYGFADPRSASRRRALALPKREERTRAEAGRKSETPNESPWTALHDRLVEYTNRHQDKVITREDLIAHLHELGLEVPSVGDKFITVKLPGTETKWRMKGAMYEKGWDSTKLSREEEREVASCGPQPERAEEARAALEVMCKERAAFNLGRYGSGHEHDEAMELLPGLSDLLLREVADVKAHEKSEFGKGFEEVLGRLGNSIAGLAAEIEDFEKTSRKADETGLVIATEPDKTK